MVTGSDLSVVIVKSNDDLRYEAFIMQLIEKFGCIPTVSLRAAVRRTS